MGTANSSSASASSSSSAAAILARKAIGKMGTSHSAPPSSGAGTYVRRAHHAGTWYDSNSDCLGRTLHRYLSHAKKAQGQEEEKQSSSRKGENRSKGSEEGLLPLPRAIVSPHAGFDYSGPTAAYAYLALREALIAARHNTFAAAAGKKYDDDDDDDVNDESSQTNDFTIVVLHPSHHVYMAGSALSGATELQTPISNLEVDDNLRTELLQTGKFTVMEQRVDEAEHSGEMQYPYIAKVVQDAASACTASDARAPALNVRVLPIMIGAVNTSQEQKFGRLLAPYLSRPNVFTIVSSDFCHWGQRFGYCPTATSSTSTDGGFAPCNQIADYIEWLDRRGMSLIEMQRPGAFADYLREYSNTICGRHPIAVWLNSVESNREGKAEEVDIRFVKYDQSSRVQHVRECSVSYASAVARFR